MSESLMDKKKPLEERYRIRFSEEAKAAAEELAAEGYALRFSVNSQGCCSLSIRIFPAIEAASDPVIVADGIRILADDDYPDFTWVGTITYKDKGLHKGFHWK